MGKKVYRRVKVTLETYRLVFLIMILMEWYKSRFYHESSGFV